MKQGTRKVRFLLLAAFMLLSVVALGLSNQRPVCAFGFCDGCISQCWNEANHVYTVCRGQGGSTSECHAQLEQYYNNCKFIFCPGCQDTQRSPGDY